VLRAVLSRHSYASAEKFVQELCWRTYWKGWLELRPGLLHSFDEERRALSQSWRRHPGLARAMAGETGIDAFDSWVSELIAIGWLHNHARMWFASIWIFTLALPWQLGADFFYKHLNDADPASNTLSWRWVAGLHSRGKHYLARASNIRDKTGGRFDPAGQLDERAKPLSEAAPPFAPQTLPARVHVAGRRVALLLTIEDLHPESWNFDADIVACAAMTVPVVGDPDGPAATFDRGALADGLARAEARFRTVGRMLAADEVAAWARGTGADEIVTGYAPVGLVAWRLAELERALDAHGQRLVRLRRDWDELAWPRATGGFFKFKSVIPQLVSIFGGEPGCHRRPAPDSG
jgi:deoxyribodipyrimidine photo-lyase